MIWTEEENDIRQLENLMKPKGKSCINCQWSNADKGKSIATCGHHLQNFSTNSFCGYWTSKNDPKVKAYYDRRKKELKAKIDAQKKVAKYTIPELIELKKYYKQKIKELRS